MAHVLARIKCVYEYVGSELGLDDEDAFTKELHAIVTLTFEEKTVNGVTIKAVKPGYTGRDLSAFHQQAETVAGHLQKAHEAYTQGRMAYEMDNMFVEACHAWGKLMALAGIGNDMQEQRGTRPGGDTMHTMPPPARAEMREMRGLLAAMGRCRGESAAGI